MTLNQHVRFRNHTHTPNTEIWTHTFNRQTCWHPHPPTHTQLISSGCELASSQLVLSCLIGWNRDRDGEEAGRGEREGGWQAGKMSTAECISKIGKTVSNPGNSLHCLIWVHREFPAIPQPSPLNNRTFLLVCLPLLVLTYLPFALLISILKTHVIFKQTKCDHDSDEWCTDTLHKWETVFL